MTTKINETDGQFSMEIDIPRRTDGFGYRPVTQADWDEMVVMANKYQRLAQAWRQIEGVE